MQSRTQKTISDYIDEIKEVFDWSLPQWVAASDKLGLYATQINTTLGQSRTRIVELNQAIADSLPNVRRLYGDIENVAQTIEDIALASRRNTIATSEQVEKLFAATKILGEDAERISETFFDVGIGIQQIPENLEDSFSYIRSIGGNTKQIFGDVLNQMDQMNRFQFVNGVQGLTKMAAQASMLRFNMNETFRLADKVLTPEGAIEVASAFQRLGVSAGNLVDPFQLMNLSINDPSGLQDSLARVTKQFTFFDNQTKSFRINPQGVLMLREIGEQVGLDTKELSKMALAGAELDDRLSKIRRAGLVFENEEDKQYLANIAQMGKGGEYFVTIKDQKGDPQIKELRQVTQEEFDNLIEEQKRQPKTLQEIARMQMLSSELMAADLAAVKDKIIGGVVSVSPIVRGRESLRNILETTLGEISKAGTTGGVRKETQTFINSLEELARDLKDKKGMEAIRSFLNDFGTQLESIEGKIKTTLTRTATNIGTKESKRTGIEKDFGDLISKMLEGESFGKTTTTTPLSPTTGSSAFKQAANNYSPYGTTSSKIEILLGGKFGLDLNLPPGFNDLNLDQQKKILDSIFNKQSFQQMIVDNVMQIIGNPTKQRNTTPQYKPY